MWWKWSGLKAETTQEKQVRLQSYEYREERDRKRMIETVYSLSTTTPTALSINHRGETRGARGTARRRLRERGTEGREREAENEREGGGREGRDEEVEKGETGTQRGERRGRREGERETRT